MIRRIWITLGLSALVIFATWSFSAYRASAEARAAAQSDSLVQVSRDSGTWKFVATGRSAISNVALLFFPGALVAPAAYAPLLRAAALQGHPVYMVELPRRGAFGGAQDPLLFQRVERVVNDRTACWVLAGHSRGAVVVSQLALQAPEKWAGLVLIGTSHPRDHDLSMLAIHVSKIVGTRDGLASPDEVEANRAQLPPATNWVWIEGGNHSQFGWYGFQPGDRPAQVSAAQQREQMINATLAELRAAAFTPPCSSGH